MSNETTETVPAPESEPLHKFEADSQGWCRACDDSKDEGNHVRPTVEPPARVWTHRVAPNVTVIHRERKSETDIEYAHLEPIRVALDACEFAAGLDQSNNVSLYKPDWEALVALVKQ